jgi:hypothetical protein
MPGAVYQGLDASSAFFPSSQSRLQDATNLLGLNLPPNTLRIIAQCQASGRLPPTLLNLPVPQPAPGTAKSVATTKARATARSHSQPNLRKSRAPSAYRGAPIPKPVAQPPEAAHYQPPPVKARARRAALAAKSKAKATAPAIAGGPTNPNPSCGDSGRTASLPTLPSASAPQAAVSQGKATPKAVSRPAASYLAVAEAISQQPGLGNIPISLIKQVLPSLMDTVAEAQCIRRSKSWVAGDARTSGTGISNSMAQSQNRGSPDMGMPTMEIPGVLPAAQLLGSLPPMVQPEPLPLVDQPQPVPAIGGGDTGHPMGFSAAIPTIQFPDWYSTMNLPAWEGPATGLATVEAPTVLPCEPEQPPATPLTIEELKALLQRGQSNVATAVNEQNAEEEQSAALECLLDLEYSLAVEAARCDTGLTLPTREDFEGHLALSNNLGTSTESGRETFMGEAGTEGVEQFVDEFLNGGWEGFVDFECSERV